MAEPDLTQVKSRVYDISVAGSIIGYTEKQSFVAKFITRPVTVSQLHQLKLDDRIVGIEISGTVEVKEINKTILGRAFPWYSTGNIPLAPTSLGGGMYQYAQEIRFHPRDMAAATTEDFICDKGVFTGGLNISEDGTKDSVVPLQFTGYPDHAQLPTTIDFGQIGS